MGGGLCGHRPTPFEFLVGAIFLYSFLFKDTAVMGLVAILVYFYITGVISILMV